MTSMDIMVKLGRFMITTAPKFADDAQFNNWARVGSQLTELGMPFAPALRDFDQADQQIVREAAAVMGGRAALPEQMMAASAEAAPARRTRRARMTKAMSKPAKAKTAVKTKVKTKTKVKAKTVTKAKAKTAAKTKAVVVAGAVKRGRGRPRKVSQ
jgi:hypothetical protein